MNIYFCLLIFRIQQKKFTFVNENVDRPASSTHVIDDLRRPDRRTPMKVLKPKTFQFVENIWTAYVDKNRINLE